MTLPLPIAPGGDSLGAIEALLAATIGLDPASVGRASIRLAAEGRVKAMGAKTLAAYATLLETSGAELQRLIEAVVVPETWFFRDRQPFVALADWVSGHWLPNARPGAVLRALSMPCSTGEEPYSIVMALLDAGVPHERFVVEAVDISHAALRQTREGRYGRNSFRGEPLDFRARHFQQMQPGLWQIAPEVRRQVQFRQANLLDPAFASSTGLKEVIFCRNLLIYLDGQGQRQILDTIGSLLAPGGIVFAGHAEAYLFSRAGWRPSPYPMAFGFQKNAAPTAKSAARPPQPPAPTGKRKPAAAPLFPPRPPHPEKPQPAPLPKPAAAAAPAPEPLPPLPPPSLAECQRLADEGQLDAAVEKTQAWLHEHGPSAGAYYLLGLAADARDNPQEAAPLYRKALYLDPNHPGALAQLALLTKKDGDAAAARRLRERLRRLEASRASMEENP